ncbi:PP2C family protein-serine/threonine phosphatase [Streptomyces chiangmaiensis]|uniref:PP2C family protein-serine/threonine phosphatase n=1 Tax=Streptomyces chiangmaiensis TaxID=766497 RepID=UPI0031E6B5CB
MGGPPRLPGLPSAHRYLASVQDPGVGGDWFDIIPLDRNRTGIVVGDVMGRGLKAAAVKGQLHAASHALARTGMPPSGLITGLDAFVSDLADQLATCAYLVIDQSIHKVTLCSATCRSSPCPLAGPPTGCRQRSVYRWASTIRAATPCPTRTAAPRSVAPGGVRHRPRSPLPSVARCDTMGNQSREVVVEGA